MASVSIISRPNTTSIDAVELDCTVSELHQADVEITEHPTEEGADVTDHVRPKPVQLTLEGIISNTPINRTQARRVVDAQGTQLTTTSLEDAIRGQVGYAEEAFVKLTEIKDEGRLITVVTPLKSYSNMVIRSLSVPRDARTGDALRFTAMLQEIRVVRNKTTTVVSSNEPKARKKRRRGHQNSKAASQSNLDIYKKYHPGENVTVGDVDASKLHDIKTQGFPKL